MGGGDCKYGFEFFLGADRVAVALGGVWCADGSEERRKLHKCAIEHVAVAVGGMFYMLFAGYIYICSLLVLFHVLVDMRLFFCKKWKYASLRNPYRWTRVLRMVFSSSRLTVAFFF